VNLQHHRYFQVAATQLAEAQLVKAHQFEYPNRHSQTMLN